jgi:hypothetical protein
MLRAYSDGSIAYNRASITKKEHHHAAYVAGRSAIRRGRGGIVPVEYGVRA